MASTLRDYLRRRSGWVWNEQARAFSHGLTLQEETLTETLLLQMARDHAKHGLRITMFSHAEEKLNGADWEWVVRTRTCDIGFRVQAKRLYHVNKGGEYGGHDPKKSQAKKLIKMAGTMIPIFLFYNHDYGKNSAKFFAGGEPGYVGRSYWGCSIAAASDVDARNSNKLADLIGIMKPLHRLIGASGSCDAKAVLGIPADDTLEEQKPSLERIIEMIEVRDFMEEYLITRELAGVAVMDLSEYRGE